MKRLILSTVLAAAPAFALLPVLSHAQTATATDAAAVTPTVENAQGLREEFMKVFGKNMKVLSDMAKGDVPYDEAAASAAATAIEEQSGKDLAALLVPGTSSEDDPDSAALPDIWNNMDDVKAKFADLHEAAQGAGEAVKGGQANIGPVLQKLGTACKACHDDYRKPET